MNVGTRPGPRVVRSLCAFLAWLVLSVPAQAADRYLLDPVHSAPVFEFVHLGITTQSGRFDQASGRVVLDRAAHQGSVRYEVAAASLDMGLGTQTADSPGFRLFRIRRFPRIIFQSTRLLFDDQDNVIAAEGRLTLLGVTRPLTVTVDRFHCGLNPSNAKTMCAGDVTATVKRSVFGMVGHLPDISDDIQIHVPIEAYKE